MSQRDDHIVERLEASDKLSKCGKELNALELEAGISKQTARAREGPLFPLVGGNHPHGSQKYKEDNQAYWDNERCFTNSRLRDAYFSVPALELRKKLIAKDAECGEIRRNNFRIDVRQANEELVTAQAAGQYWWLWASAIGGALVVCGYEVFGAIGALVAALAAFFYGRHLEDVAMRERASAVSKAQQNVLEAQRHLDEVLNEPPRFSSAEATGEERSTTQY